MAQEQSDTRPSQFDDPWTKYFHDLGRAYPSGTQFRIPAPQDHHHYMKPAPDNWLRKGTIMTSNDPITGALTQQSAHDAMMNVPLSHLQHMAGTVVPFPHPKDSYMDRDVLETFNRLQPQGFLNRTQSFTDPQVRILPLPGQK